MACFCRVRDGKDLADKMERMISFSAAEREEMAQGKNDPRV